jgi:hypothetical protein
MDEDEQPTEDEATPVETPSIEDGGEIPGPSLTVLEADEVPAPDPFAGYMQDNASVRVGTWAGFPNYECSACQYASLDEAKTQAHLSTHGQTFTQGARP